MRFTATTALVAAVLAGGAGCGRGDRAPDCKSVGAAYATLQQREIEKAAPGPTPGGPTEGNAKTEAEREKEQALSLIPVIKEAVVKECEAKQWNAEARRCVVEAKTPEDLERCRTRPEEDEASVSSEPRKEDVPAESGTPPGADKAPETAPTREKPGSP